MTLGNHGTLDERGNKRRMLIKGIFNAKKAHFSALLKRSNI